LCRFFKNGDLRRFLKAPVPDNPPSLINRDLHANPRGRSAGTAETIITNDGDIIRYDSGLAPALADCMQAAIDDWPPRKLVSKLPL